MAPGAKRKRLERASTSSDLGRPSPHRPADSTLGQHDSIDSNPRTRTSRSSRRLDRRDSMQSQASSVGGGGGHGSATPASPRVPSSSSPATPQVPAFSQFKQPPAHHSTHTQHAQTHPQLPTYKPSAPSSPAMPSSSLSTHPTHHYNNLTGDILAVWAQRGRVEIIQHGCQSRVDIDHTELSSLFQEFIRSVTDGRLDPVDAGDCVREILGPEMQEVIKNTFSFEPHTLFLDTLSVVADFDPKVADNPVMRDFLVATGVSPVLMRQVLDPPLLQKLGLIRDSFVKIGIRVSTNLLYRQANYNLLREETEGYSKLVTELFSTACSEAPGAEMVQAAFERVKALIGTFDLDVGRVLDVTLDIFATILIKQFRFFVRFLRVSSWWPTSQQRAPGSLIHVGGLPLWALPESSGWQTSDEDEERLAELRCRRDVAFWDRARQRHADAWFELAGHQTLDDPAAREAAEERNSNDEARRRWIEVTNTAPPSSNRVAAQLLGFKLRFYTSDARDEDDVLPANLLYLAALLIKIGFISLCDLYPHLYPLDQDMPALRDKKLKELEEEERKKRPGAAMNALMAAGALTDDTMPATASARRDAAAVKTDGDPTKSNGTTTAAGAAAAGKQQSPNLPEPLEQKVTLLICLLTIGAIPESLFILGRFPWLPEVYPDILHRVHRILHHSIGKVYERAKPVVSRVEAGSSSLSCAPKKVVHSDQSGMPKGSVRLTNPSAPRYLRWPWPDKVESDSQGYRFYWDEWADNVPVCQTVDDVFTLCGSLLNISGVNVGKDEGLLSKLSIIGAKSLADDKSDVNSARWQDLLRRLLLPALSMTSSNPSTANLVWALLKRYPTATRYAIYAEWYEGQISRLPALRSAFERSRLATISTMKRMSKQNIAQMAKALAKISHSSPGIVFKVALDQMEVYANLIEVFVNCAKYFTELSYDVLVWALMSSLGGKVRSRTQESSVLLTSKWLQSLARLSGTIFKRYAVMDPVPVIRYVHAQLLEGNSTDLIILRELISIMGGVIQTSDFTDDQITAMSGGPVLRKATLIAYQDRRFEASTSDSARRLMEALARSGLAAGLLVNLAQYRQASIFAAEDGAHVKFLSSLLDDTHQMLTQFLDFLRSHLDPAAFEATFPGVVDLMHKYGLDASLAFLIGREGLADRMFPKGKDDKGSADKGSADKDIKAKHGDAQPGSRPTSSDGRMAVDESPSAAAPPAVVLLSPSPLPNGRRPTDPILDTLQPITDSVQSTKPAAVWSRISPEFYVMFWTFQLGDLAIPTARYKAEQERIYREINRLVLGGGGGDPRLTQARKKERISEVEVLITEQKDHEARFMKNKIHITRRFKSWFLAGLEVQTSAVEEVDGNGGGDGVNGGKSVDDNDKVMGQSGGIRKRKLAPKAGVAASDTILEQCILPRAVLSPADAEYCHKLIRALHDWGAPGFRLMTFYDRLFNANRLRTVVFACTVREAEAFGRFLRLTLGDLSAWHKDTSVYSKNAGVPPVSSAPSTAAPAQKEAAKVPTKHKTLFGFATALGPDDAPAAFVEHEQFRDVLYGWHKNVNSALKACLGSSEWMHIRNGVSVLKSILDYFPSVNFMGEQFVRQLKTITDREGNEAKDGGGDDHVANRRDLATVAQATLSELQKRNGSWVIVQAFRPNTYGEKEGKTDTAPPLRPTAPEFKPQPQPRAPPRTGSMAVSEDGEIRETRQTATTSLAETKKDAATLKPLAPVPESNKETAAPTTPSAASNASPRPEPPRSSTSKPVQAVAPTSNARPDGPKSNANSSSLPERPPPGLPNRPDVPMPVHYSERMHQRGSPHDARRDARDSRDARGPRDPRENREGRGETTTASLRERESSSRLLDSSRQDKQADLPPPPDKRGPEQVPANAPTRPMDDKSSGNLPSDMPPRRELGPRERTQPTLPPPPSGPSRTSDADLLGAAKDENNNNNNQRILQRPTPNLAQPDSLEPRLNPKRAALLAGNNMTSARPLEGERENDRSFRGPNKPPHVAPKEDSRDRPSSRTHQQRRSDRFDPEVSASESFRDDRQGDRPHPNNNSRAGRDGPGESPSSSFQGRHDSRMRDGSSSLNTFPAHSDRLETDHSRHGYHNQDQNYGRLGQIQNAASSSSSSSSTIPSAPRGHGRGVGRGGSTPTAGSGRSDNNNIRFAGNSEGPRALSPDRHHPPTGPSARGGRRALDRPSGPSLQSPTTTTAAGASDRTRQAVAQSPTTPTAGIHPDRLVHISHASQASHPAQGSQPPPAYNPRTASAAPPPPERSQQHGPSRQSSMTINPTPSSTDNATPTGPSSGRSKPAGPGPAGRNALQSINNTLQSANSLRRVPSSRNTLSGSDARILTGASPVATATEKFESSNEGGGAASTGAGGGGHPADKIPIGDEGNRGEHDRPRRGSDRPSRGSRRSSRERGRERSTERSERSDVGKEYRDRNERERRNSIHGSRDDRDAREPRDPRDGHRRLGRDGPSSNRNDLGRNSNMASSSRGDMGGSRAGDRGGHHRSDGGGRGGDDWIGGGGGGSMRGAPRGLRDLPGPSMGRGDDRGGGREREPRSERGGRDGWEGKEFRGDRGDRDGWEGKEFRGDRGDRENQARDRDGRDREVREVREEGRGRKRRSEDGNAGMERDERPRQRLRR